MLPDVRVNITDGGLGILPASLAGRQAKVGICSAGPKNQIVILSDRDQVLSKLGTGPLANACLDAFAAGASVIYAVPANGDVAGSIGDVTATKTGTGSMTVSGAPLDDYQVIVAIVNAGNLNQATFKYSLDGGDTFSAKITVPTAGTYQIPGTGITLTFTDGSETPFAAGDMYSFNALAPSASISSINEAIDVLLATTYEYEFIHVVGPSDNAVWAALDTRAAEAEASYRFIHFIAEARGLNDDETVDEWVAALVTMKASFASTRVSVVAGRLELVDTGTGRVVDRNGGGIYTGRVSAMPVQSSPGKVIEGPLPGIVGLQPVGINEGHILTLDEAGFVTFRQYVGLSGFYITNGRMMAEDISDFQYVELRRVMDKACRACRTAALRFEHAEATTEGIAALQAHLQAPLDQMAMDKEATSASVLIPDGQDIISTSKVKCKIRIIPVGIMRVIELDIGFENPFLGVA